MDSGRKSELLPETHESTPRKHELQTLKSTFEVSQESSYYECDIANHYSTTSPLQKKAV